MLGPVSAWVGDHWQRTRHPSLLSLSPPSMGRLGMSTWRKLREQTGTSYETLVHIRGLAVFAGAWLNGLASRDQGRRMGSIRGMLETMCYTNLHLLDYFTLLKLTVLDIMILSSQRCLS